LANKGCELHENMELCIFEKAQLFEQFVKIQQLLIEILTSVATFLCVMNIRYHKIMELYSLTKLSVQNFYLYA